MRTRPPVSFCLLLLVVFLSSVALAQTSWQRTYGGADDDVGNSVQQTADGGYIIVGSTYSFGAGGGDVYLVKTNSLGDTLWTKTYGGPEKDHGGAVQQTTDGGYIVAGTTESRAGGPHDVYLVRTNDRGDTLWTRTYGGGSRYDDACSVVQTSDSGYIIASRAAVGPGNDDVYLIKTDAQGDTLWTKTYGGAAIDAASSVQQTLDGGYIVTGWISSYSDVYLIRTNAQGDTLWTKTYGGQGADRGNSVRQTADGGFIVAGRTRSFDPTTQVYLIKTNTFGDTLWTKAYGGAGSDRGYSVQPATDGGYIIAGSTNSLGAGGYDAYLVKTNAQGDTLWTRIYGGASDDHGYSVQQTLDGGYIITGCTSDSTGNHDVYLIKTNPDLDVGRVAILAPPGIVDSGQVYVPTAIVRNFGLTPATFPVTMEIGTDYAETMQETLASGISDTVVFPTWTAEPIGSLAVTCFTSLPGDMNPANDTIRDTIQVLPPPWHDVGAVAIVSPSGSVRAGDTVIPRATIRNFGNRVERYFDVRFWIGASYSQKVNVADAL